MLWVFGTVWAGAGVVVGARFTRSVKEIPVLADVWFTRSENLGNLGVLTLFEIFISVLISSGAALEGDVGVLSSLPFKLLVELDGN